MDSVKWSDLPKELWPIIGKFLHTRIDVLRFRSVCSLWRSSRPPFERPRCCDDPPLVMEDTSQNMCSFPNTRPPPPLPLKFSSAGAGDGGAKNQALLFQSTTYRMESLIDYPSGSQSKPCSK
ncbi:hypothetical protein M0R45_003875 [Rubus argutus]|uniref:F-box domain-containing protein n=1 Tax=Rubus argutus TaxID=59490 RepID=A0AAW1YI39_RUBAR